MTNFHLNPKSCIFCIRYDRRCSGTGRFSYKHYGDIGEFLHIFIRLQHQLSIWPFLPSQLFENRVQANINLSVGGIGLEFGYNTLTSLIDDSNIIESILLGIQVCCRKISMNCVRIKFDFSLV